MNQSDNPDNNQSDNPDNNQSNNPPDNPDNNQSNNPPDNSLNNNPILNQTTFYIQPGQNNEDLIGQITDYLNNITNITNISPINNVNQNIQSTLDQLDQPDQPDQSDQSDQSDQPDQSGQHLNNSSDNIQMLFEIEFLMDENNIPEEEDENIHFDNCNHINEVLGKPVYICKEDILINTESDTECNICMDNYKYKQYKRILPKCNHVFHKKCIDNWLKKNSSCPVCRTEFLTIDT
tara:strand:- start:196 stop:900 length:705 start_codon:yes stop_codon:yes gene_type:complete